MIENNAQEVVDAIRAGAKDLLIIAEKIKEGMAPEAFRKNLEAVRDQKGFYALAVFLADRADPDLTEIVGARTCALADKYRTRKNRMNKLYAKAMEFDEQLRSLVPNEGKLPRFDYQDRRRLASLGKQLDRYAAIIEKAYISK